MKKTAPQRVSPAKRKGKTVEGYWAAVPQSARDQLVKLRSIIHSIVPKDAAEVISYGIPAFRKEKIIVWYAAFSDHCSLFPTAAVIEEFKDDLKNYTISKGTIQFPLDKPLPSTLIKRIVKARLAQVKE